MSQPYRSSPKISHRAWFSREKYKQLYEVARKRAPACGIATHGERSSCTTLYCLESTPACGLTPGGQDIASLKACLPLRDVTSVNEQDPGKRILETEARGKRGVGYCKSVPGEVRQTEGEAWSGRLDKTPAAGNSSHSAAISKGRMANARTREPDFSESTFNRLTGN